MVRSPLASLLRGALVTAVFALASGGAAADEMAVVAKRVIYPGETIAADSLVEVRLKPSNRIMTSVVIYPEQIEGKVAKRTLLPGKLIPIASVRDPYAVEAGAPVPVNFIQGGLQISTLGIPLQPGAAGDMVKVRNADSGAIFSGMVMVDGTIRVGQ